MEKKEKTLTFRRHKRMYFDSKKMSDEEAKKEYVKQVLSMGYVPVNVSIQKHYESGVVEPITYVESMTAWAGKKSAQLFGEQKVDLSKLIYLPRS